MVFNSKKEKIIFYTIPTLLFSLLPFFLITGPFLSDLSVSVISILFLIYCIKTKNFSFFKNKYFYFFLFFWLYLVLNSLIKNFNLDSFKISFFYFRYGVFIIAIVALIEVNDRFIKFFFYCILLCFTILILHGFYEYFYDLNLDGRVSSFFGDEKILGSYLVRLWPIFFGLSIFYYNKTNKLFIFLVLIFVLSEALIFLSGERAAFFFINLSAIFVILLSKKLLKLRLITLFLSIFLLVIISFVNPTAKERVFDKTLNQMNLVDGKEGIYIFTIQHTHHYITAYKMFLDNKILGVGVKNFRNYCGEEKYKVSKFSCANHPHNTYVQILAETGLIGFSFLLFALLYFCKYFFKHLFSKFKGSYYFTDFEICILSGIVINVWPFVPTGNIFNNWLNIAMILNFPFLIWSKKKIKDEKY